MIIEENGYKIIGPCIISNMYVPLFWPILVFLEPML